MLLPSLLFAACVVQGQAVTPEGEPVPGAEVWNAETGERLTVTGADGSFRLEAGADPGADGSRTDLVLEVRALERLPAVRRVPCGGSASFRLPPRVYELEGLEISATRLERSYEESAVRIDRLDGDAVTRAAGSSPSLAQAIQQLPGVGAIGRDGFTSAPTIRGMGRDRSLVLLEGMRLSSDRGVGPSGSFLDPFLLRNVDVVRGASGVAYGSGAIGGVVSLGLGTAAPQFAAAARVATASNGDGRLVAGRVTGGVGPEWRLAGGGFFRSQGDYSFPDTDPIPGGSALNSGFDSGGGALVAERTVGRGSLRVVGLATGANEIGRPTTRDNRIDTIEKEDHGMGVVRYGADHEGRRTEAVLGYHRPKTINRTERFADDGTPTRTGRVENVSSDLTLSGLIERPVGAGYWLAGLDGFARLGVDATETNVRYQAGTPQPAETIDLVSNATRLDVGAFGGWHRLINHLGQVTIAGRVDVAQRSADERSSVTWVAPSVTAGIVYPFSHRWALTGSAGRSFRAPRIQELYFEGDRPGGTRLANPDLKPETAWSAEVGARWSDGSWFAEAGVWGLLVDDLIVQLPVDAAGDTLRNENEETGTLGGVEALVRWAPGAGRTRASLAYAFQGGRNEDDDPLPDVPPGEIRLTGETRVWGETTGQRASVRIAMRAGGAKTPVPAGTEKRWWADVVGSNGIGGDEVGHPGYSRWDLGARLHVRERIVLDVSVVNVLDSQYLDRAEPDAYPQPGRSVLVELTLGD